MTAKKRLPKGAVIGILVGVFVLVAVLGWFVLISPQRSKAAELDKEIASTEQLIASTRALLLERKNAPKIRVADVYRVTKAMPDQADMAGIVLELNRVAAETGIAFDSITPQSAVVLSGYQAVPIDLVFDGNFYNLTDFLFRLRNLVDVRRGALHARGRLFAIDKLTFVESPKQFPRVQATLTVDAFVFGDQAPANTAPEPAATAPDPSGTTTTGTTTTGTTTTTTTATPPASEAAAAGASGG